MEIMIIVLLLVFLWGIWTLSVRRRLEVQEINIQNALNQIRVQILAEQEALTTLTDLLEKASDRDECREIKRQLELLQKDSGEEQQPEKVEKQLEELLQLRENITVLSEQMPLLRSGEIYQKYLKAANSYEHMVKTSSLIYNDSVENFNRMLCKMPDRLAAGICGFHQKKCLKVL